MPGSFFALLPYSEKRVGIKAVLEKALHFAQNSNVNFIHFIMDFFLQNYFYLLYNEKKRFSQPVKRRSAGGRTLF